MCVACNLRVIKTGHPKIHQNGGRFKIVKMMKSSFRSLELPTFSGGILLLISVDVFTHLESHLFFSILIRSPMKMILIHLSERQKDRKYMFTHSPAYSISMHNKSY